MKVSEGVSVHKTREKGWAFRCRPCGLKFVGFPNSTHADIAAREHFATLDHLVALKRRRDTEQLIDTLFALVGIEET